MNPTYILLYIGSLAFRLANAANSFDCEQPDLTAHVHITANTEAGKAAIMQNSLNSSPKAKIQILSEGAAIPTGVEVKHVKITPGKKVVISVDPCDDVKPAEELAVIPQSVEPSVNPAALPPGEQELVDGLEKNKSIYDDMSADDLEEHMKKVMKFFDLVKEATSQGIIKAITAPQITLIGESDELKRSLIGKLTGIKSEGASGQMYSMPVLYKLVKNASATAPIVKVDDKPVSENLFKVLDAMNSSVLVEVEIQSANIAASLIFVDLPEKLPVAVKRTFMEHAWNFIVAIGSTENSFEDWDTLKLARSFDEELKRIFTFTITSTSGNEKEQNRIKAIALGLQQSYPKMANNRMFYEMNATTDPVCQVAKCGDTQVLGVEIQRKFLKIWSQLRPGALKIIQAALEAFETRIKGYEAFEKTATEDKWNGLIGQVGSVLIDNILFLIEERDDQLCGKSSILDSIKESILSSSSSSKDSTISFAELFANYQREIAAIRPIPEGIDESAIKVAIEELRTVGPKAKTISELNRLLFSPQSSSLASIKQNFIEKVKDNWRGKVEKALGSKFCLEPYEAFKTHIKTVGFSVLSAAMSAIDDVNKSIDESDETSKWTFNFFNSSYNSNIWIELIKAASVEDALAIFYRNATEGFTNICNVQAALQVRFVIDKLLSRKTLQMILKEADDKASDKAALTEMSKEAKERIAKIKEWINKLKEAISNSDGDTK